MISSGRDDRVGEFDTPTQNRDWVGYLSCSVDRVRVNLVPITRESAARDKPHFSQNRREMGPRSTRYRSEFLAQLLRSATMGSMRDAFRAGR